jgi:oligopeptide/dipeptide ABC transporter ATP-binding protein
MGKLLEMKDLCTYFFTPEGVIKAVDGVSYDIDSGETVALVGESGCGKTVSALSILRLIPNPPGQIISGQIVFEGENLVCVDEQRIRSIRGNRIAMIFQEPMSSLNPVLTIGKQIGECLQLHRGMDEKAAATETARLLQMVGIPEAEKRLKAYPHQFSGGMRQRVMIAMALSCNPKLVIADEPTTALDVTIQAQLLEIMKNLTRELGTALLIITHNLGVVARYADRVNVLYAGRIVETGTAKDIYHDPRHPYTVGLMASVPRLDHSIKEKLMTLPGLPPDLGDAPPGCGFNPRCSCVFERCRHEMPPLVEVSPGHWARCHKETGGAQA